MKSVKQTKNIVQTPLLARNLLKQENKIKIYPLVISEGMAKIPRK